jgi:hypothetical protein
MKPIIILLIICLTYMLIALATNRGFIVAPRYRLLLSHAQDCKARADVLAQQNPLNAGSSNAYSSIISDLRNLSAKKSSSWFGKPVDWMFSVPLTKMAADQQSLNAVERRLVELVNDTDLDAYAGPILLRSEVVNPKATKSLAEQLNHTSTPSGKRIIISSIHLLTQEGEEVALVKEFDQQRIGLWLALVGLIVVFIIGMTLDHEVALLMGALGGFLSPVVAALTTHKASSWGIMVLSPVGGALTAVGGLLIVRLLSDPKINILGSVFLQNSWDAPGNSLALGLALLFGFSGQLFSRLAISATSQLASPVHDADHVQGQEDQIR